MVGIFAWVRYEERGRGWSMFNAEEWEQCGVVIFPGPGRVRVLFAVGAPQLSYQTPMTVRLQSWGRIFRRSTTSTLPASDIQISTSPTLVELRKTVSQSPFIMSFNWWIKVSSSLRQQRRWHLWMRRCARTWISVITMCLDAYDCRRADWNLSDYSTPRGNSSHTRSYATGAIRFLCNVTIQGWQTRVSSSNWWWEFVASVWIEHRKILLSKLSIRLGLIANHHRHGGAMLSPLSPFIYSPALGNASRLHLAEEIPDLVVWFDGGGEMRQYDAKLATRSEPTMTDEAHRVLNGER